MRCTRMMPAIASGHRSKDAIFVVNPPRRPLSLVDGALAGLPLLGGVSVCVCDDGAQLALLVVAD